jgi:L-threonylcarbamoyladenylate synthase
MTSNIGVRQLKEFGDGVGFATSAKVINAEDNSKAVIEKALKKPLADKLETAGALRAPGQLESHYAPSIPVRLNATSVEEGESLLAFGSNPILGAVETLNLSAKNNLVEAAANLFAMLRKLDNPAHKAIAVMPIPMEGIGEAINDRLRRAAADR